MHSSEPLTTWTWEEESNKFSRKDGNHPGAAPVSAFRNQKVLLSEFWDEISIIGTVGEIDLNSSLQKYITSSAQKKTAVDCDDDPDNQKEMYDKRSHYWFVEAVQFEGYLVRVRFLGFAPDQTSKLTQYDRWICYNDLQEIGYYKYNGIAVVPQITLKPSLNGDDIMKRLFSQIIGKPTVSPSRCEWIDEDAKYNRWKVGSKVEVRNRDCCTEMRYGYVRAICGPLVEVAYYGTPVHKRESIWVHKDSDMIHLPGWTKTAGGKLHKVQGYDPVPLEPTELRVKTDLEVEIKVGMLFEFINPIRLDEIALGKVTKVLSHGYFNCCIESGVLDVDLVNFVKGVNEFHYHITSGNLFALGTFTDEIPSPRPVDAARDENFRWDLYLKKFGLEALPLPSKTEEDTFDLKESTLVEAVDTHRPELICPAVVVKVVNQCAVKVRFLGWGKEFDQWKAARSYEIFPIGWCQLMNYPLEAPIASGEKLPVKTKSTKSKLDPPKRKTAISSTETLKEGASKGTVPIRIKNSSNILPPKLGRPYESNSSAAVTAIANQKPGTEIVNKSGDQNNSKPHDPTVISSKPGKIKADALGPDKSKRARTSNVS